MKKDPGPLDQAFLTWCNAIEKKVEPALRAMRDEKPWFRNPNLRIVLNDRSFVLRSSDDRLSPDIFDGVETESLVETLQSAMSPRIWPLSLLVEIDGLEKKDWWVRPRLVGAGFSGLPLDERSGGILQRAGWRDNLVGLDRLAEAGRLLDRLTPPSNMPVRAWSRISDMMGSTHVHHQGASTVSC